MSKEREKFEKAAQAHKAGAPYKTFEEAVKSKTYKEMHSARKEMAKKIAKKKPSEGMSRWSSSHNSGKDDNYDLKPKGKGTRKDPYRFD